MTPRGRERQVGWAFVAGQGLLIGVIGLAPRRSDWPVPVALRVAGLAGQLAGATVSAVAATGLGSSLAPLPTPAESGRLHTGGAYASVRHPIYSGLLLATGSRAAASGNRWPAAAFLALVTLLQAKARYEELLLAQRYPEYADYAATTPRFLPRVAVRRNR